MKLEVYSDLGVSSNAGAISDITEVQVFRIQIVIYGSVGNTRQSRTDVSHISSTSNGTIAGLVDSAPSKRVTNTSWADVVRRGNCSDERTLRLVAPRSTNQSKAFREIILSKQSSE